VSVEGAIAGNLRGSGGAALRAAGALAAVSAGMMAARHGPAMDSVFLFGLACLLAVPAALLRGRACAAALCLSGAALGAGWFTLRTEEAPVDSLRWLASAGGALVTVEGVVLEDPEEMEPEAGPPGPWAAMAPRARLMVKVDAVETPDGPRAAGGRVRVIVGESLAGGPRAGDQVRIKGTLHSAPPPLNPGERDRRLVDAQDGVAGTLNLPRAALIERLPASTGAGVPEAEPWWRWPLEQLKAGAATTILCWALALPIVIYHTGLVSPLGLMATAIVVPLVTVMLWLAYALLVVGMLIPAAAEPAGAGLALLAGWTVSLVKWMDSLPLASVVLPRVSALWTAVAVAVVLYWCLRGYLRNRLAWGLTAGVLAWLGVEVWYGPRLAASIPIRIDTLAVGDGTCHLVRSRGEAILWDCGSMRPGVGRWVVPRAVRALGAWRVRTIVITHPNFDHYSGVLDAAGPLGVRTVIVGERFLERARAEPGGAAAAVLDGLAARGIDVRIMTAGESIRLGVASIALLSPPESAGWAEDNDHSLVGLVRADAPGAPTLLLTGDIQDGAIERLLTGAEPLRADVMELPHHGGYREAAARLVAVVDPSVVVQSSGPGRAGDVRWDLLRNRRAWYTTATDGASWVELRADGMVRSGAFLRPGEEVRRAR
jgi:beta-lactamase superfamily II metal-dependent hydrolase